ncbi:polyphosphate polymerase domain-containing protein [Flavilitoribacter nigricans]|uniref:VTC domain-containing protein n=1 Tax=Flavilitoribacter nigricans (strain ATCC 23147 / DSM 23189 / NBRC 102662 / NCIMB 1420 / SS-2) TaxID=1122177 RepID=A0A2D0N8Y7_FLAN2|nr:polyphosphate polymerase domain-containing protein [Flavilitoribacter nigricans]PHN04947.1 hypothetical protein CRP01_18115 [Flavilitoribacter nigricans DSM 23189 = NBRC 102662]
MRYERKFPSTVLTANALEQLVLGHPLGFRKVYPDRRINNVYFDTPGWRTFHENLAGVSHRTKYRLRWYGPASGLIEHARFELKKKENLLGTKIIHTIAGKITLADAAAIPGSLPTLLQNALFPTLVNSYQRAYYESTDGAFRLTVDEDLSCNAFDPKIWAGRSFPPELRVVELKYGREDDQRLDEFTQYWPLRLHRFSKYVMGMQLAFSV